MEYERSFALCDTILQATKKPFEQPIYYKFLNNGFNISIHRLERKQNQRHDVLASCVVTMMDMKKQTLEVLFCKYIHLVWKKSEVRCTKKYILTITVERPNQRAEVYVDYFTMDDLQLHWIPKIEPKKDENTALVLWNYKHIVPRVYPVY